MIRHLALVAALSAAIAAPVAAQLSANKRADLSMPVVLAPGQSAIIVGFRRPGPANLGKSGSIAFARYDVEKRDMIPRPKDAKKNGDTTTYWIDINGGDKKLPLDHIVMLVSPGDYALYGATLGPGGSAGMGTSYCFSAPIFSVKAGETVYFGDMTPYLGKLEDGQFAMAMPYSSNIDDARAAIANQPALMAGFRPAEVRNGASFTCSSQIMSAYLIPGLAALPPLTAEQKAALAAAGPVPAPREATPAASTVTLIPSPQ